MKDSSATMKGGERAGNNEFSNAVFFCLFYYFMCIRIKVSYPLELVLQTFVSCHVNAGN